MISTIQKVGAVVLTYNSAADLPDCLLGLLAQRGIELRIIVVDNASRIEERVEMESQFLSLIPDGQVVFREDVCAAEPMAAQSIFIRNAKNDGYSAGNNVGAKVACAAGCDAVLIINPDMRISDINYVAALAALASADEKVALACSAVHNLAGGQENPMSEPGLLEELLLPLRMVVAGISRRKKRDKGLPSAPFKIMKATGACFLIRSDFLSKIDFFDESVFLYCEESILMMQARSFGWHMVMDPRVDALHAHRTDTKGSQLSRFRAWSDSRAYFHAAYGEYGSMLQKLLSVSRSAALGLIQGRECLRTIRGKLVSMCRR